LACRQVEASHRQYGQNARRKRAIRVISAKASEKTFLPFAIAQLRMSRGRGDPASD
jgi:hypothetical protein